MKKLILIRHGESEWNKLNLFTGWTDVDLTENGCKEAFEAGKLLKAEGYKPEASGDRSHAEGGGTLASGKYSHAEGCDTTASGDYSHAEG